MSGVAIARGSYVIAPASCPCIAVSSMSPALLLGCIAKCLKSVIRHFPLLCSEGTVPKAMAIACWTTSSPMSSDRPDQMAAE